LAERKLNSPESPKARAEALYHPRKAVKNGHPKAMLLLAKTHLMELPDAPELRVAIQLVTQAMNLGAGDKDGLLKELQDRLDPQNERGRKGTPPHPRLG